MRNTTKLKIILEDYNVDFSMNGGEYITLTLYDKETGDLEEFENKSYTSLITSAYSFARRMKKNNVVYED
ncbi:hypothetical protein BC659_0484 [Sediminibacterium goheungense]|uniref:Uncharacterized protein n=1 Tax=Sediminibacterium goheungense TaxID=1086393 RepID=A0A4R6IZS2_9BACT|nr:hypothetical protein BC659_0484 [Sediminibacterium goheungense]